MKVYIALRDFGYEGSDVLSVHDTAVAALLACSRDEANAEGHHVEEYEVKENS